MKIGELLEKITDKNFRHTAEALTKYILILLIVFLAYLFMANYVLQRSEEFIGYTGVYNYSFEMKQNHVHIRFNTLEPMASMIKFADGNENVVVATKDYRMFHEHVAALKPNKEYTMTIDIKARNKDKITYKKQQIDTHAVSIMSISVS